MDKHMDRLSHLKFLICLREVMLKENVISFEETNIYNNEQKILLMIFPDFTNIFLNKTVYFYCSVVKIKLRSSLAVYENLIFMCNAE